MNYAPLTKERVDFYQEIYPEIVSLMMQFLSLGFLTTLSLGKEQLTHPELIEMVNSMPELRAGFDRLAEKTKRKWEDIITLMVKATEHDPENFSEKTMMSLMVAIANEVYPIVTEEETQPEPTQPFLVKKPTKVVN